MTLVLGTRREVSVYELSPGSDAPLILRSSAPLSTPCRALAWHPSGATFVAVAENTVAVWSKDGSLLYDVDRVREYDLGAGVVD